MTKLLHKQLSYKIVGILYEVYNELGSGYQEKYYQRAVSLKLVRDKIKHQDQVPIELKVEDKSIGRYYLDSLIEDKIILELKVGNRFYPRDYRQVRAYLKKFNLELGILSLFSKNGVKYERILNRIEQLLG